VRDGNAQSIILRPGLGERYIYSKPDYTLPNNFDPSFNGNYNLHRPTANIALELLYPRHSFELVFTSQMYGSKFYSFYEPGVKFLYLTDGGVLQFQTFYNKFSPNKNYSKKYSLGVFAGAGIGIGINPPASYYDSLYIKKRIYSLLDPDEYLDFLYTPKSVAKISYSVAFKIGFVIKKNNIERARVHAVYNLGLNKIIQDDVLYYHTNTKYWGSYTFKGSQFSFLVSMPIYLKRKK
jgi:hypothetical protein